jgi:hypothetical protein
MFALHRIFIACLLLSSLIGSSKVIDWRNRIYPRLAGVYAIAPLQLLLTNQFAAQRLVAQNSVVFRVVSEGVHLRGAPSVLAPAGAVAISGATYRVIGRSEDNTWLALQLGADNGWLPAAYGEFSGDLAAVGVYRRPAYKIVRNPAGVSLPNWIRITPRARQLFAQGAKAGRDPRMFTIAGDSNSAWPRHLGRLTANTLDKTPFIGYGYVLQRYDPSFARQSVAVGGGYRAADMFLPEYAHPACAQREPMFPCELRQSRASVVFIQLGTGDKFAWREFETNLKRMLDHAIQNNVVPVLMTKADDLESIQGGAGLNHINDVIRRQAEAYQVPLIDWYAASRSQPVIPNPELPKRPFIQNGLHDEWGYYFHLTDEAFALRVQSNLQVLDALTR